MLLTIASAEDIRKGQVLEFVWKNSKGFSYAEIGVVWKIDDEGIWYHREGMPGDFVYSSNLFNGTIEYNVLLEHPPIKEYPSGYDFVSNHE